MCELIGEESPTPFTLCRTGRIHSGGAAQADQILDGNDGYIGHRRQEGTDRLPRKIIIWSEVEIAAGVVTGVVKLVARLRARMGLPPTGKCIVVVRPGVGDEVSVKVVREGGRVWGRLLSELHHRHRGQPEPAHRLAHTI